jgi:hypothetical protein
MDYTPFGFVNTPFSKLAAAAAFILSFLSQSSTAVYLLCTFATLLCCLTGMVL